VCLLTRCTIFFQTPPEFPEFCWTELIVNAVAHRDYSIGGTDIQIKVFDDHLTVESPGLLPGLVRVNNIREFHFSRNPKIVELLNEYDLVKEFGEGVDRVYRDMAAGLPEPEYRQSEFMLYATLKNKNWGKEDAAWGVKSQNESLAVSAKQPEKQPELSKAAKIEERLKKVLRLIETNPEMSRLEMAKALNLTEGQVRTATNKLKERLFTEKVLIQMENGSLTESLQQEVKCIRMQLEVESIINELVRSTKSYDELLDFLKGENDE